MKENRQTERKKNMGVIHLTKENFQKEVLEAEVPVLVDFWATWCGPCQMVGPIVEELAGEVTDAKICKVDVDDQPELARKYHVMSIPTFLVFRNGEVAKRDMGAMPKEQLMELLKA
ncbi:MAG: thioredoxin [Dorea sp.]